MDDVKKVVRLSSSKRGHLGRAILEADWLQGEEVQKVDMMEEQLFYWDSKQEEGYLYG
jgi:hypothetical protein